MYTYTIVPLLLCDNLGYYYLAKLLILVVVYDQINKVLVVIEFEWNHVCYPRDIK